MNAHYSRHIGFHLAVMFAVFALGGAAAYFAAADSTSTNSTSGGGSTYDTIPPTPPTGLYIQPHDGRIGLSWVASMDNVGVAGYRVFRNNAWYANVSSTGFTDEAVTAGVTYTYFIKATDAAGNESPPSGAVSATLPLATNTPPPSATTSTTNTTPPPTSTAVMFEVTPQESFCEDGIPVTTVVLTTYPLTGGYYRIVMSDGHDALIEPGAYPMRNMSYRWEGIARNGFTRSGNTNGTFTLSAPLCATAAATTSTTVTPPPPPPPASTTPTDALKTKPVVTASDVAEREADKTADGIAPPTPPSTAPTRNPPKPGAHDPSEVEREELVEPIEAGEHSSEPPEALGHCANEAECHAVCALGSNEKECAAFVREHVYDRYVIEDSREAPLAPSAESVIANRSGARAYIDLDKDGVTDFDEVNIYDTDPQKWDTNDDGVSDGNSLLRGEDPLLSELPDAARARLKEIDDAIARGADPMYFEGAIRALKQEFPHVPEFSGGSPAPDDPKTTGTEMPTMLAIESIVAVSASDRTEHGVPVPKPLVLSGKALPNAIVTLYIFSDPIVVRVKADASGAWTYTLDKELPDGAHEVYSAITDTSGRILAKSSPLPFVKQAEAITLGTNVLPNAAEAAPSFWSGVSAYALVLMLVGVLGLAFTVIGLVVRRRGDDDMTPPGSERSPTVGMTGATVLPPLP